MHSHLRILLIIAVKANSIRFSNVCYNKFLNFGKLRVHGMWTDSPLLQFIYTHTV